MGATTQKPKSDLFAESIKSEVTKKIYSIVLVNFKRDTGIADLQKVNPKQLQAKLIDYVIDINNSGKSYSTQNTVISALQKYCEVYDIEGINFKKVRQFTSEPITNHNDIPYSKGEISMMLESANLRTKATILLMLSAGLRIGALGELKIRDLQRIDNHEGIYKVTVYSSSDKYRYTTFTTPEAAQAIDIYLQSREVKGEVLKPDSPLFRQEFVKEDAHNPIPVSVKGFSASIFDLVVGIGIRKVGEDTKKRQKTMLTHSFRKIFNTSLVKASVKPVVVELLLGHSTGMQRNYLRLSEEELLGEYLKSVELLTISKERELQKQVEHLKVENAGIIDLKTLVIQQQAEIEQLKNQNKMAAINTEHSLKMLAQAMKQLGLDDDGQLTKKIEGIVNSQK